MADKDEGTDTTTTHYNSEGEETGTSESHSEPSSNPFGELIGETISTVSGGALDDDSSSDD